MCILYVCSQCIRLKHVGKLKNRNNLLMKLVGSTLGASASTLWSSALALSRVTVLQSGNAQLTQVRSTVISGTLHSTPLPWLPVLSNIELPALQRKAATDKLVENIVKDDSWPIQPHILNPPFLELTSRKPLWLDLQPADIKSRWRHKWKSAEVVNSHLVCDPTVWQPGFDLPQQQRSLLNRFRTEQGH